MERGIIGAFIGLLYLSSPSQYVLCCVLSIYQTGDHDLLNELISALPQQSPLPLGHNYYDHS